MKKIISIAFFCLPISSIFGQNKSTVSQNECVAVSIKQDILYADIPNTIKIFGKDLSCNDLRVKTNNGRIAPTGTPCYFTIVPRTFTGCDIMIVSKNNDSLVGLTHFRTLPLPSPQLLLDNKVSGKILINEMKAQTGVAAEIPNFDIQNRFVVKSFSMTIMRGHNIVINVNNIGDHFSDEIKQAINNIKKGDKILIWNITIVNLRQNTERINPAEYEIE